MRFDPKTGVRERREGGRPVMTISRSIVNGTRFYKLNGVTRLIVFPRGTRAAFRVSSWILVWRRIVFAPLKPSLVDRFQRKAEGRS